MALEIGLRRTQIEKVSARLQLEAEQSNSRALDTAARCSRGLFDDDDVTGAQWKPGGAVFVVHDVVVREANALELRETTEHEDP